MVMKELSIEEKAKRYDEALKVAKDINSGCASYIPDGTPVIKAIFPELKESEDEKIRKAVIDAVETLSDSPLKVKMLAWLEKQGKNNMGISEATKKKLEDNLTQALGKEIPESWNEFLEKQGEQKQADKVEPKFHKGEWVVDEDDNSFHQIERVIENITSGKFSYDLVGGGYFPSTKKNYHLWTIQDAKDGDVLVCESGWTCIFKTLVNDENFSSYCFMDNTKWFCETGSEGHTLKEEFVKAYSGKIYPATKEQRDTLMKAMADAGYTFDFEKKELKKIEQKSAWSEEDALEEEIEEWLGCEAFPEGTNITPLPKAIDIVRETANHFYDFGRKQQAIRNIQCTNSQVITPESYINEGKKKGIQIVLDDPQEYGLQTKQEWSEEDEYHKRQILRILKDNGCSQTLQERTEKWIEERLKSLRPQSQWKPSDEQMKALKLSTYCPSEQMSKVLFELYQDLKKLRGE